MHVQETLGQAEALGQILVQVQAQGDVLGEVVVHQTHDALQVLHLHAAEGVHDGEGEGVQLVHLFAQPQNARVGVAHDVDGVAADLVALVLGLAAEGEALFDVVVVEGHPDHVDAGAVPGLQLVDVIKIMQRHAGEDGVLPVSGQHLFQLGHGVPAALVHIRLQIAQKAHLHDVGAGVHKALHDVADVLKAEFPVIHIAPVPQGAVEQTDVRHKKFPFCPKKGRRARRKAPKSNLRPARKSRGRGQRLCRWRSTPHTMSTSLGVSTDTVL